MANNDLSSKLLGSLQNKYGSASIMLAKDIPRRPAITTGTLALDYATGIGGFPQDRVIEIAGAEGTGKTTLALLAMEQFLDSQPRRGALIMDVEHKLSPEWISMLVGEAKLEHQVLYAQPASIEEATNIYKAAVRSGIVCFAMLDSIGGAPTARRNDDAEVASYGGNALGVGEFARTANSHSARYNCLTVGINQIRADMSGYNRHMVPGGLAWLHAPVLRLQLKKGKGKKVVKLNNEDYQIGYEIACKIVKNGVAAPGRTASWWFYNVPTEEFGFGVDRVEEAVRLGLLTGVIERKGAWYIYPGLPTKDSQVQGQEKLLDLVRDNKALREQIGSDVTAKLQTGEFGGQVAPMSDPDAPIDTPGIHNVVDVLGDGDED